MVPALSASDIRASRQDGLKPAVRLPAGIVSRHDGDFDAFAHRRAVDSGAAAHGHRDGQAVFTAPVRIASWDIGGAGG